MYSEVTFLELELKAKYNLYPVFVRLFGLVVKVVYKFYTIDGSSLPSYSVISITQRIRGNILYYIIYKWAY